jgi:PAS domain S-box-containing protein
MTYRFSRLSIRTQLFMLVLIALAPAFTAFVKGLVDERQAARVAAQGQLKVQAELMATRLGAHFADNEAVLGTLAQRPQIRRLDGRQCDPILKEYVALHPEFTNIVARDLAGANTCSVFASAMPQAQALAYPWFAQALQSDVARVSDAIIGPQSRRWVAVSSHPIRDDAGQKTGLLLLPTDLLQLNRKLLGSTPPEIIFTVTDGARKIVLRSVEAEKWIGQPPPAISSATQGQVEGFAAGPGLDGVRRLFAFTQVPKVGWRVVAGVREDVAYAASDAAFRRGALVRLGILLLALALAWWMGRAMVRPIESLARTVTRLVAGETSARAPLVHGPAEIEAMTQGFNQMLQVGEERHRALLDALATLQAGEERYRSLLDTAMDGFWLADSQGRLLEVNDTYCRMSGYAAQELLGMQITDLEALETASETAAHIRKLMAQGVDRFETRHRRKDGSILEVEVSAQYRRVDGGRFVVFLQDITERKQALAELQASEERFRSLTRLSSDWYWEQDAEFRFVRMDGELEMNTGIAAADHIGRTRWDMPALNMSASDWEAHQSVLRAHLPFHDLEMRRPDRAGRVHWVSVSGAPIFDAQGRFTGYRGVGADISERKQAQAALHESEERYRTLVEWSPESIVVDRGGVLVFVNPAAVRMFGGTSAADLIGKATFDLIHPDSHQLAAASRQSITDRGIGTPVIEPRLLKLDGTVIDAETQAAPIVFDGAPAIQVAMRDVTARKQAQAALQSSLLEKVALLKEVHHRVKNNLQVITSLLRLEAGRSAVPGTRAVLADMQGRIRSMSL